MLGRVRKLGGVGRGAMGSGKRGVAGIVAQVDHLSMYSDDPARLWSFWRDWVGVNVVSPRVEYWFGDMAGVSIAGVDNEVNSAKYSLELGNIDGVIGLEVFGDVDILKARQKLGLGVGCVSNVFYEPSGMNLVRAHERMLLQGLEVRRAPLEFDAEEYPWLMRKLLFDFGMKTSLKDNAAVLASKTELIPPVMHHGLVQWHKDLPFHPRRWRGGERREVEGLGVRRCSRIFLGVPNDEDELAAVALQWVAMGGVVSQPSQYEVEVVFPTGPRLRVVCAGRGHVGGEMAGRVIGVELVVQDLESAWNHLSHLSKHPPPSPPSPSSPPPSPTPPIPTAAKTPSLKVIKALSTEDRIVLDLAPFAAPNFQLHLVSHAPSAPYATAPSLPSHKQAPSLPE